MNKEIVLFHNLPDDPRDPKSPTIREVNLEKKHNIPIGALVEVKYDRWFGDGACMKVHARLYVVEHQRDCDGTPLYSLSNSVSNNKDFLKMFSGIYETGFSEEKLTVIEITDKLEKGYGSLGW